MEWFDAQDEDKGETRNSHVELLKAMQKVCRTNDMGKEALMSATDEVSSVYEGQQWWHANGGRQKSSLVGQEMPPSSTEEKTRDRYSSVYFGQRV